MLTLLKHGNGVRNVSWLVIRKTLKKASAWCVQHWRWLVLLTAFLITYILGGRKNRSLLIQANLAKKQYQAEANAIEAAHNKEIEGRKRSQKTHRSTIENLDKTKEESTEALKERNLRLVEGTTDDDVQEWLDGKDFKQK